MVQRCLLAGGQVPRQKTKNEAEEVGGGPVKTWLLPWFRFIRRAAVQLSLHFDKSIRRKKD